MKRQVRDRIDRLEVAAANRSRRHQGDDDERMQALREVALAAFPVFRAHVIAVLERHGSQAAEDFAGLAIGFHEKVHSGRDFRHATQSLLGELGVRDPMLDPLCWCSACMAKQSANRRSR